MTKKQPKVELILQAEDSAEFYGGRRSSDRHPHLLVYAMTFGHKNRAKYGQLLLQDSGYVVDPNVLHLCNFFIYGVLNHAMQGKPIPAPSDLQGLVTLLQHWQTLLEGKMK